MMYLFIFLAISNFLYALYGIFDREEYHYWWLNALACAACVTRICMYLGGI